MITDDANIFTPDLLSMVELLCSLAHDLSQSIHLSGSIEKTAAAYHLHEVCEAVKSAIAKGQTP